MTKGKQVRGRAMTFNAGHSLEQEDLSFLRIVSMGNLPKVKETMEILTEAEQRRLMQLTDFKDRTALEIATEVEHFEIVEYLVLGFVHLVDEMHFHECLMLAISKGYMRITQVLLENPAPASEKNRRISDKSHCLTKNNSKFNRDVTPVMMAAQCNEVDIIRLLLSRGETISEPHPIHCQCHDCSFEYDDPLMRSLARLHLYQALASEAYISLTSPDPILTAFLLTDKLIKLAAFEKEFKNEYRELAKQCKQFASDLLDMCQTTDEVQTILTQEATTEIESQAAEGANTLRKRMNTHQLSIIKKDCADFGLPRLELAIKYRQKQFVAHPHCQHHLATLWYKGTPSFTRQWHTIVKCFMSLAIILALPILALIYWFYPKGAIADFMRSPRTKFMMHASMYILFLTILFLQSVVSQDLMDNSHPCAWVNRHECLGLDNSSCEKDSFDGPPTPIRQSELSSLQIAMMIFVIGMLWSEVKQIFREGYRVYFESLWNWIDIAMLNLLISSLLLELSVICKVKEAMAFFDEHECNRTGDKHDEYLYWLPSKRMHWESVDPTLLSEALFAIANVLSFARLSYILPVNEFLGPLQISVQRMMGQILRFGSIFILMFLAFFCALTNLYWYYPDSSSFGKYDSALITLVWALFGLGEAGAVHYPSDTDDDMKGQPTTEFVGLVLYVLYHLVMALVMLNMLIAMMTTSFQEINDDEDVEWKFARSQLWMTYFDRGATLPIPLNVIPSPKSVIYFFKWLKSAICPNCEKREKPEPPLGLQHLNRRAGIRKQTTLHESLMKTVVKRYLFKLQNDKEGEEGAEGELEEIKNDISSFRCEVLETMKKMTHGGSQGGNGFISPQLQDPFGSPDIGRRPAALNVSKSRLDLDLRMASLENRVSELTESFTEFFAVAKEALQGRLVPSNGDDRVRAPEMCKTQ